MNFDMDNKPSITKDGIMVTHQWYVIICCITFIYLLFLAAVVVIGNFMEHLSKIHDHEVDQEVDQEAEDFRITLCTLWFSFCFVAVFLLFFGELIFNAIYPEYSRYEYDQENGKFLYEVAAGYTNSNSGTSVSEGLPWNECLQELETQYDEIRMRNEWRARAQGPESVLDINLTCRRVQK